MNLDDGIATIFLSFAVALCCFRVTRKQPSPLALPENAREREVLPDAIATRAYFRLQQWMALLGACWLVLAAGILVASRHFHMARQLLWFPGIGACVTALCFSFEWRRVEAYRVWDRFYLVGPYHRQIGAFERALRRFSRLHPDAYRVIKYDVHQTRGSL